MGVSIKGHMDFYPNKYLNTHVVFSDSFPFSSLNLFISITMNSDADAVRLIHLLFDIYLFLIFCKVQANSGSSVMYLSLAFQQCVFILLEQNNGAAGNIPTPLNRKKKSFQSIIVYMPERGERGTRNTHNFTFQSCRRNLIQCIPSLKKKKVNLIKVGGKLWFLQTFSASVDAIGR